MAHALRASAYSSLHRLGGANQGGADARFHRRVAGIGDDHVLRLRPGMRQGVRRHDRTNHVVAALNDDRRYVPQSARFLQQLAVFEEHVVDEVVRLDPASASAAASAENRRRFFRTRNKVEQTVS